MATVVGMTRPFPGVQAEAGEMFGHAAASLQSGVSVAGGQVTGTLKYVASGALPTRWGAGNFLSVAFTGIAAADAPSARVGLSPSAGSGLVALDSDLNGAFKVTDKDLQALVVETRDATGRAYVLRLGLSGLVCEGAA